MPAHISSTTRAVAMVVVHHRASHLHHRRPQRIQRCDVEFRCGVEAPGGGGAPWRQHAVATHQLTGVLLADQQVVAVLVEPVDIEPGGVAGQRESGFAAEHVVTKPLGGLDVGGVGGEQQRIARIGGRTRARGGLSAGMRTDCMVISATSLPRKREVPPASLFCSASSLSRLMPTTVALLFS